MLIDAVGMGGYSRAKDMPLMQLAIPRYRPNIPFGELGRSLGRCLFAANRRGATTATFERRLAERLDAEQAVALCSVRFGLFQTLKYLRLPADVEVLCTPLTIYPIIETVILAGCKPVFVDLESSSFSPDLTDADQKVTPRARVFLVTHLWGVPAKMEPIVAFCERHKLILIEDASQCFNGRSGGRAVGTFGLAGLFSFSTTKTINTYKGAALVTADRRLADALRETQRRLPPLGRLKIASLVLFEMLLAIGFHPWVHSLLTGPLVHFLLRRGRKDYLDYRGLPRERRPREFSAAHQVAFGDIQARTGLCLLQKVGFEDRQRRNIAAGYERALAGNAGLRLPLAPADGVGNYWMYAVLAAQRDELRRYLWDAQRVDSAVPSIDACHRMDYFAEFRAACPQATATIDHALYIPCYPSLNEKECTRVAAAVDAGARVSG